jgi:hypothetical protein
VSALVTERGIVRDPRPGSVAALFGPR